MALFSILLCLAINLSSGPKITDIICSRHPNLEYCKPPSQRIRNVQERRAVLPSRNIQKVVSNQPRQRQSRVNFFQPVRRPVKFQGTSCRECGGRAPGYRPPTWRETPRPQTYYPRQSYFQPQPQPQPHYEIQRNFPKYTWREILYPEKPSTYNVSTTEIPTVTEKPTATEEPTTTTTTTIEPIEGAAIIEEPRE